MACRRVLHCLRSPCQEIHPLYQTPEGGNGFPLQKKSRFAVILLVSGATKSVPKYPERRVGRLLNPRSKNQLPELILDGRPWAADNDAFKGFRAEPFLRMLKDLHGCSHLKSCLFVAAPDHVGNWRETLSDYVFWQPMIRSLGFPVACVAQDGATAGVMPWRSMQAVFIGGTTDFKMGTDARTIVAKARALGVWVHMGRVNGKRRVHYAKTIGVQSIDGTGFSRWPDTNIPLALSWIHDHSL